MYWAQELAAQTDDPELRRTLRPARRGVGQERRSIVAELTEVQGEAGGHRRLLHAGHRQDHGGDAAEQNVQCCTGGCARLTPVHNDGAVQGISGGCSKFVGFLGTTLGPHVVRAGERPARRCTPCTPTSRPHTARDLRKCVTAIFWGSGGRRFKLPRSPRLGCAWRIRFRNASGGRSTARPAGGSRAWDPTPNTTAPRAQATRPDTCYSLPAKLPSSVYKIKPGSEVSGKTGEPHTAHSCGVLGTPTTIVSTRLTLFLACQGGEARHGCILRGARVRDHPAKRALKLRAVLAQAPPC